MAYGDIFEVDGQLYEVTPVGYMPVSPNRDVSNQRRVDPPASMLTEKPSETGGMLTGGNTSNRTYTYVREESDLPGGSSRDIWNATKVTTTTGHSGLTDLFNSRKEYQQIFGSADNFISYMDQMHDLQQANPELYNWWETDTEEQFADANGYPPEAAYEGLEAAAQREFDREYLDYQIETREQQFINMSQSEDYRGLVEQFGLNDVIRNNDGDIFAFNGGFPVEIFEVDDNLGLEDYGRIALAVGLSLYAGPFLSSALAPSAGAVGTTLGAAASGAVTSAMSQLIISGEIDTNQLIDAALTAGVGQAAISALQEANTIEKVQEWLNTQVGEFVQLENGQLFQLNNPALPDSGAFAGDAWTVTLPSGAVLDYDVFLGLAESVYGSPVVGEISRGIPNWLSSIVDATNPVFEGVRDALESLNVISGDRVFGAVGSIVENVQPINDAVTLISQLEEAIENARNEGNDEQADAIQAELNVLLGTDTTTEEETEETVDVEQQEEEEVVDVFEGALPGVTPDKDEDTDVVDIGDIVLPETEEEVEDDFEGALPGVTPDKDEDTDVVDIGDSVLPERDEDADEIVDNAPGITDEMFQNVIDQVRADNQVETQEIIDAINALGIADLPTLEQIKAAFPELNDVSLEQIGSTVSTLLSEAGLLTTEQFTEAMSGVLTPDQLATALANLPYGTAEDFIDAITNAGYATPEDVATALNNADLMSNEDFSTYMEQFREDVVGDVGTLIDEAFASFVFPETFTEEQIQQLRDSIVIPEGATMEQIQTALDALAEQIPDAAPTLEELQTLFNTELSKLNIASPQDVRDALAEFNFSEAQIAQIIDALPEGLTVADLGTALEGVVVGEDLDAAVTTITDAIGGLAFATPEDVRTALAEFGFTEAQLEQIVGALPEGLSIADLNTALENVVVGADLDTAVTTITNAISGLDIASPDDIRSILANYGFSEEQLEQIAGAITIPASATVEDVQNIIDNLPAGLTAEQVATELSSQFEGLTKDIEGVQSGINQLAEDLGLSTEGLLTAIANLGTATGENLTDLQTNILQGLGTLSENLGVDISDVVTSVTDLETGVAEGIEGLGEQLTGLGEGITGVQGGIEELAEQLGLSTEDLITAIGNLGTATGESLTGLETSILTGLGNLADTLGLDVGEVVTSVTDLSTDVVEGIEGLEGQLTTGFEGVQGGIDALAEQLGVSSEDIVTAIGNLGTLTSDELTGFETSVLTGLTDLASTLGLDIGDVVTSVTDLGVDFAENITGLSEQLTGVEEAVGGVTTAVNQGIEDLATALGVQTDDIEAAIVTLGSGLGGELTELETSVLAGLTTLAANIGTDVGTVVDSIGGLGTGIGENIQGLSDTLTQQLGEGFGGLGTQLGEGFGQLGALTGLSALGLFGLGASQEKAQQLAAARDFEFKPFEEQMKPRQVQQVVQARRTQQQPSALQQLNQFIDRQSNVPRQGMLVPQDPNRNIS